VLLNILIAFSDLKETCVEGVVFTDLTLHGVFSPTPDWRNYGGEGCHPAAVLRSLSEETKHELNLTVHQDGGLPRAGIPEILETEFIIAEISMP
jgi:hypothetical protein